MAALTPHDQIFWVNKAETTGQEAKCPPCLLRALAGPCGNELLGAISCFDKHRNELESDFSKFNECSNLIGLQMDCFQKYPLLYGMERRLRNDIITTNDKSNHQIMM